MELTPSFGKQRSPVESSRKVWQASFPNRLFVGSATRISFLFLCEAKAVMLQIGYIFEPNRYFCGDSVGFLIDRGIQGPA